MSERMDRSSDAAAAGDDHDQHDEQQQQEQQQVPQYYTTRRQSPSGGRRLPKRKTPLGQLPDSLDEVNLTTTDHGEDVARSLGGIAALPAVHQFGQIGLDGPNSRMDGPNSRMTGTCRPTRASGTAPPPKLSLMQFDPSQLSDPSASTSQSLPIGHWNLRDADVRTLPEFHPLDQAAVFVPNCPDASVVAGRISSVLRARSISTEYTNSKAKAKCVTADDVEFRVRLYRGKKHFAHGVIVEVQRRYGFCPAYAQDVAAILDAAEGKNLPLPRQSAGSGTPPPPLPSLVTDEEYNAPSAESDSESSSLESIPIASAMLADSTRVDRQSMGLRGLASLTDSYRIGATTATRASAEIVAGSTPAAASARDAILALVLNIEPSPVDASPKSSKDKLSGAEIGPDADAAAAAHLRTLALAVLSNVLTNLSGTPELVSLRPVLSQAVLPALLSDLKSAATHPRRADLAARCLLPVVETFDADYVEAELIGNGAYELLVQAQSVGEVRYDSLREGSTECLRIIDERR